MRLMTRVVTFFGLAVGTAAVGCSGGRGGDANFGTGDDPSGGDSSGGSSSVGGSGSGASGNSPGTEGGSSTGGGQASEAPGDCTPSVSLYDVSSPAAVIGTGTAESCTEALLRTAAEAGGVITFNCGNGPVTIQITQTINLPNDKSTVIDGGDKVTLDAGKRTRHFHFEHPNWMVNTTEVVLQRLTVINGQAPLGEYYPPKADPKCSYGYKSGSGGAILIKDGRLRIINSNFYDNEAAPLGPDVGGGAIYALGSASVIISGSTFRRNRASNGGAIGMLFANPEIYNSVFEDNTADGIGANFAGATGCGVFGHEDQGGAGGLGGGVYFDGMSDINNEGLVYTICGSLFRNNRANTLSGALFRTPNEAMRKMIIERSVFDRNTAGGNGGATFIMQNDVTVRESLFTGNRGGVNVAGEVVNDYAPHGGLWIYMGSVDVVNSTFHANHPMGLTLESGSGTIKNATFSEGHFSGNLTFYNSLFVNLDCGQTASGANNLQWPSGTACASGTEFADPALGSLQDNGGPTWTRLPGNAAAVAGVGSDCPTADQRGLPRDSQRCAAGAVEP